MTLHQETKIDRARLKPMRRQPPAQLAGSQPVVGTGQA